MSIKLNTKYTEDFVSKTDLESIAPEIKKLTRLLLKNQVREMISSDGWISRRIMIKRNLKE